MPDRIDKDHPAIQKEIHAQVDGALRSRALDAEAPIRGDLLKRVRVFGSYRGAVIRFCDDNRRLFAAEICLDHLLNGTEISHPNSPAGPMQLSMTDKEALFVTSEEIGRGEVVVVDDRLAR